MSPLGYQVSDPVVLQAKLVSSVGNLFALQTRKTLPDRHIAQRDIPSGLSVSEIQETLRRECPLNAGVITKNPTGRNEQVGYSSVSTAMLNVHRNNSGSLHLMAQMVRNFNHMEYQR